MISMVQDMAGQMANNKFKTLQMPKPKMQAKNSLGGFGEFVENTTGIGGGRRIDPVKDLTSGVGAFLHNPIDATSQGLTHLIDPLQPSKHENTLGPSPKTPKDTAPEVLAEQQRSYEDFKSNMPRYASQLRENLGKEANRGMYQNMRNVEQRNVSRGLGYGGLNESMKEAERSKSQQALANQVQGANLGLIDLGSQIQSGAIQTGMGMQGDAQQRLNQIYQQQLAKYGADTQAAGSQLGFLANLAMMAALA